MRIEFLTCASLPSGTKDDAFWVSSLKKAGADISFRVWDADPPSGADATVFRSVWDYVPQKERAAEFLAGLKGPVFNPPGLVRWNMDKRYLLDLESAGIPIVPTAVFSEGMRLPFEADELVLKPAVSSGAFETHRVQSKDAAGLVKAAASIRRHSLPLVQPFLIDLVKDGEWSLVYFKGRAAPYFSHAVLKKVRAGDFRVQEDHGGTLERREPPTEILSLGNRVMEYLEAWDWLYCRLDVVLVSGKAHLSELEVFEPELFFRVKPDAAELAARCLLEKI